MELLITVWKPSGNYYTSCVVNNDVDIPEWKDEFDKFIRSNLPARIRNGYITVQDTERYPNQFHFRHYTWNQLYESFGKAAMCNEVV